MKTPMQEFIEVLKIHRDTAFEKAEHFKSHDVEGMYQWYDFRGQTLNDAISFAELQLEKEKGVMLQYGNDICCPHHGDENDALYVWNQTFNTNEK